MSKEYNNLPEMGTSVNQEIEDMLSNVGTDIMLSDEEGEDFEPVVHSPIVSVVPAKPMTALETNICELYSTGKSTKAISTELSINMSTVRNILGKPHIKEFVNDLINAQYMTSLEGRLRLVNSIIDAKLERIEVEFNGDMASASKKDVLDLIIISDNMQKERTKKELGASDNVYVNIINSIMDSK